MNIIETPWGKVITWGYNAEEKLRDLRKLQSCFDEHPSRFEEMCVRCDDFNKGAVSIIEKLDKICAANENKPWPEKAIIRYDKLINSLSKVKDALWELTVYEYPELCREEGYSFCI